MLRQRRRGFSASKIITKRFGFKLKITTDYTGLGKIQYILGEKKIKTLDSEYTDQVVLHTLIPNEMLDEIKEEVTEGTAGRAVMEVGENFGTGKWTENLRFWKKHKKKHESRFPCF